MKKFLPWFLIPTAMLFGASLVRLTQLRNPALTQGVLASRPDGTIYVATGLNFDASGNIILPPSAAVVPTMVITKVTATTPNSFPIPAGKTFCDVSRNIPQAPTEDYTILSGAIVFNSAPQIDDVVRLICF